MIYKEFYDNQLYLHMNGQLLYKRWLKTGQSLVFNIQNFDSTKSYSVTETNEVINFMISKNS